MKKLKEMFDRLHAGIIFSDKNAFFNTVRLLARRRETTLSGRCIFQEIELASLWYERRFTEGPTELLNLEKRKQKEHPFMMRKSICRVSACVFSVAASETRRKKTLANSLAAVEN